MSNLGPLTLEHPLEIDDARRAGHRMSQLRQQAEKDYTAALIDKAETEATYRKALSEAFVRLRDAGVAGGAAEIQAKGDVVQSSKERDIAEGMAKAAEQRLKSLAEDRATLHRLVEWSMRVQLASEQQQPTWSAA